MTRSISASGCPRSSTGLVALREDDLFPAITIQTDIKSSQHVFASGTRTSGMKKYWTQAHGGKYWIWLDWQITT